MTNQTKKTATLYCGDNIEAFKSIPDNSIDSIVTDPPYGLEFMGKDWDAPWKTDRRQTFDGTLTDERDSPFARQKVRYGTSSGYTGAGFAKPGIGDRQTAWPSFAGTNNTRCDNCGKLVGQGGSPCKCGTPAPRHRGAQQMQAFQKWNEAWAREAYRVLKPGGHMICFSGARTYHRTASAVEDAGFEIRDQIMWLYGTGFPKSLSVGKAIDKAKGAERALIAEWKNKASFDEEGEGGGGFQRGTIQITAPATPEAAKWEGWGTALKPAHEPILVARKPLDGTVAANVLKHGTGGVNIDECRVGTEGGTTKGSKPTGAGNGIYGAGLHGACEIVDLNKGRWPANVIHDGSDEVEEAFAAYGVTKSGAMKRETESYDGESVTTLLRGRSGPSNQHGDSGSVSRFFFKAPQSEEEWLDQNLNLKPVNTAGNLSYPLNEAVGSALRNAVTPLMPKAAAISVSFQAPSTSATAADLKTLYGAATETIQAFEKRFWQELPPQNIILSNSHVKCAVTQEPTGTTTITLSRWKSDGSAAPVTFSITQERQELGAQDSPATSRFIYSAKASKSDRAGSKHPTVKPISLMRYLCRLVTPPGGTVLDPFAGSGTTGQAAVEEGFNAILMERDEAYTADIENRFKAIQAAEFKVAKATPPAPTTAPVQSN